MKPRRGSLLNVTNISPKPRAHTPVIPGSRGQFHDRPGSPDFTFKWSGLSAPLWFPSSVSGSHPRLGRHAEPFQSRAGLATAGATSSGVREPRSGPARVRPGVSVPGWLINPLRTPGVCSRSRSWGANRRALPNPGPTTRARVTSPRRRSPRASLWPGAGRRRAQTRGLGRSCDHCVHTPTLGCISPRFLRPFISLCCRTGTPDILATPCPQGAQGAGGSGPALGSQRSRAQTPGSHQHAGPHRTEQPDRLPAKPRWMDEVTSTARLWSQLPGQPHLPDARGLAEGGGQVLCPQKMKNVNRTENRQPWEVPGKKRKASGKRLLLSLRARSNSSSEPPAARPGHASAGR